MIHIYFTHILETFHLNSNLIFYHFRSTNPSYWVLNCNPRKRVERIWEEQTTHRIDYTVPPKITRPSKSKEPIPPSDESRFQFIGTGKMETASTSMKDYSYPETEVDIPSFDFNGWCVSFQSKLWVGLRFSVRLSLRKKLDTVYLGRKIWIKSKSCQSKTSFSEEWAIWVLVLYCRE